MKPERQWWHRLGTMTLTVVSAVGLFKAAGFLDLSGAPLASWVIFFVCVYGLGQIYEIIFDIVAAIVDAKRRQLARRRAARVA
jgi:hypothetical protein